MVKSTYTEPQHNILNHETCAYFSEYTFTHTSV